MKRQCSTSNNATPKGRKLKKRSFNFTPQKHDVGNVNDDAKTVDLSINKIEPIGLVNIANDCFFNSVVQALFALPAFCNHVKNFVTPIPDELNANSYQLG